jgi:CSLREA domain-containing protein
MKKANAVACLSLLSCLLVVLCLPGRAATFTVSKIADTNDGTCNADCSLREAINAANSAAGNDIIAFVANLTGTLLIGSTLPDLSSNIELQGPGPDSLTVQRSGAINYRIFTVPRGASVIISGLTLRNGRVTNSGGAISNSGNLQVVNCVFDGNHAGENGGAISNYQAHVGVTDCRFTSNRAVFNGGAIVTDGRADPDGNSFGPTTLFVQNSSFTLNTAGQTGGGISIFEGGLTLLNSTLDGNTTSSSSSLGGGLHTVDGSANITGSTLSNNAANDGGGLYSGSSTTIRNSTIANNTANFRGGGVSNNDRFTQFDSCTIAGNKAPDGQGSGIASVGIDGSTTTRLTNTIVAGNTTAGGTGGTDVDFIGNENSFDSENYNLIGDGNAHSVFNNASDRLNIADPQLGPLADNGGPTKTRAPYVSSPAINNGNTTLTIDQRGVARPQGTRPDIGAHEFNAFANSLVVTTLADEDDGASDPALGAGTSLREALNFANSDEDTSTITFGLPGTGTKVINLTSALPDITAPTTIQGPGAGVLTVQRQSGGRYRIFTVNMTSLLTISGLTITNGDTADAGGAISANHLTLLNCILSGNNAEGGGGAILVPELSESVITITNCTIKDNIGRDGGGAIIMNKGTLSARNSTFANNSTEHFGGAIYNYADMTFTNCTFRNNRAGEVGGGVYNGHIMTLAGCTLSGNSAYRGGGMRSETLYNNGSSTLRNCTISGNSASYYSGLDSAGITVLDSCTITANTPIVGSNGGVYSAGSTLTRTEVRNSIIAGNTGTDVDFGGGPEVNSFQSNGYNVIGDGNAIAEFVEVGDQNDISGTALKLGALANNGGATQTHLPLSGSPALNRGNTTLTTDQRGVARPQGSADDVGAVEVTSATALPLVSINDITIIEGNSATGNAIFTVTLSKTSTSNVTVNYASANGTARAPGDFTAANGTLTFTAGQTSKTIIVPVIGDLLDEANEAFYVLLSSPSGATLSKGRGVGTITDNDAMPSITIDNVSIGEGNPAQGAPGQRVAAFRLHLSAPSGQSVRVTAATAVGTVNPATAGNDYVALAPTVIAFNAGSNVAYARVYINGDLLNEADETFLVNLTNPLNATIADNQAIGTILNDDSAPAITINDANITEGNAGTKTLTFTVSLSKASGQTITVNYATADGIARSTSDYVTKSGTLSFAPGSALTRTISITINGDTLIEGDETLYVILSGAVNASLGRGRGVGTIINDDSSG